MYRIDINKKDYFMTKSIILDNNALYIENYKNIDYFDNNNIQISCKMLKIIINGTGLQINSYNKFSIKISGLISNIEYKNIG